MAAKGGTRLGRLLSSNFEKKKRGVNLEGRGLSSLNAWLDYDETKVAERLREDRVRLVRRGLPSL